ncbi:bacterial alpha-L-rhamnosidase-domain-containing protein [Microdochium bolleyi]|uniref:alpha-L-rhamnosidase n=1 Tax=Microdochium bolleyi TaxID=196109 RepID=A0A136JGJ4_9PEZI|nr:bacterial alpha-L-rhamnosidase-domain-containing protein [Microdochium bolleyi]
MAVVVFDVQFEHYRGSRIVGIHETRPRLSWKTREKEGYFVQRGYEVECTFTDSANTTTGSPLVEYAQQTSSRSVMVPWPFEAALSSRQQISIRIRVFGDQGQFSPWSDPPSKLELGLLDRSEWKGERIAAPLGQHDTAGPSPEQLYRKTFDLSRTSCPDNIGLDVRRARLYITSQGVYEAELNGTRIGDHFLAPGWTAYDARLQYQTYDVTSALRVGVNCLAVRVAEGWFSGRLGFEGGHRNIWGEQSALLSQLEIITTDGEKTTIVSDQSWHVTQGPIRLAEIYDGEHWDATKEVAQWSSPALSSEDLSPDWEPVAILAPLARSVELTPGFAEPVRRIQVVKPVALIMSPSGRHIVDFGQNLVGYVRVSNIRGPRDHKITLRHAEVLENGELGTRPLRVCKATDVYTLKGDPRGESYEPRFTFHGFRYAEIEGWLVGATDSAGEKTITDLQYNIEAVVCHTDMKSTGSFVCSEPLLNKLHENVVWSMRGNFLSVPTDCPQRDERLGWTGDLAVFAPTATLLYDCFGIVRNWLIDVAHDQKFLSGVPPMVSPNVTVKDPRWLRKVPCAIWHDATILVPWALYLETNDKGVLEQQWESMVDWIRVLPRGDEEGRRHLWSTTPFQLGDWLDPTAPPDAPWRSPTDALMVANMFLIHSLDLMVLITSALAKPPTVRSHYVAESRLARSEFHAEYVTPRGRLTSDTQTAYAAAICLEILDPGSPQMCHAGARLAHLTARGDFRLATGFAGTPYVCEALARTGHMKEAYALLLERQCPSWLYPVTMGATTVWERWDSMLPDGSINPGEMTSFNHYALGAIVKFMYERVVGLQRLEPGWSRFRVSPMPGAELDHAAATHETRFGLISVEWKLANLLTTSSTPQAFYLTIMVPHGTIADVVLPTSPSHTQVVGPGTWTFSGTFVRGYEWPLKPLPRKSN